MTERLIGIDFGTSTTVVHIKNYTDGKPSDGDGTSIQYLEFDGQGMVPTLIQKVDDTYYFGYDAKQPKKDEKIYRNFKMKLESSDEQEREEAEKLTLKFFQFLHKIYEEQKVHFGTAQNEKTLISYPAKWTERTRRFMVSCAEKAGFSDVRGMDEPTAAMYSVCVQERERMKVLGAMGKNRSSYVLMIDMGAGTTDLALCKYKAGEEIEILITWPSTGEPLFFGGHEMDQILMDILKKYLLENGFSEEGIIRFMSQYEETCRVWKENTVSNILAQNKQVDFCFFISSVFQIMGITPGKFPVISRKSLEHIAEGYLKIYAMLVKGILENAKKIYGFNGAEQIDFVILTGGHSQWYFAESVLTGEVDTGIPIDIRKLKGHPERIIRLSRPQETVARGMVYSIQEIMVVSKEEEMTKNSGKKGGEKNLKIVEDTDTKYVEKTVDSGKSVEKKEEDVLMQDSDIDGSERGFRELMDRNEAERRFRQLTYFYNESERKKIIMESNWRYHEAMKVYIGELYFDNDEEYITYWTKQRGINRPNQSDVDRFMNVMGRSVTDGQEKILLTIYEEEGIIDKRRLQWLITTEKVLLLSKDQKTVREILFSEIRYFVSARAFLDMKWNVRSFEAERGNNRILMNLYARWRKVNGLNPYQLDAIDYYESMKHTELGKDDTFLYQMGKKIESVAPEKALRLFKKAERGGNKEALLKLAYFYFIGIGTENGKDYRKAADYIEQYTGQMTGKEIMPSFIGGMYEEGGYGLQPDIEKAIFYYNLSKYDEKCLWALRRLKAKKVFDFFKKK